MSNTVPKPPLQKRSLLALARFVSLLTIATSLPAYAQTAVPATAPENFTAVGQDTRVALSWGRVAGATNYNLWRDSGKGYVNFATTGDTTSYVDAGLMNGKVYQYAINAANAAGASSQFAFANATTVGPVQSEDKVPVAYTSFPPQEAQLMLYPWEGRNLVLLTASQSYQPAVIAKIVSTLDAAYDYYVAVTGRTPSLHYSMNGKGTIAEVDVTCGAGCGYLGLTGIELLPGSFAKLYSQVASSNLYDQVLFYELGRNFSFYGSQIDYKEQELEQGTVITGYAVYMRFKSMQAAGAQGAPFNGQPFETFKANVAGLVDSYEASASSNWQNTLRIGKAHPNTVNGTGPDLVASMVMRLERDYGGETFVRRFWKEVGNQPSATTTQDALNNFVRAASAAASTDLTSLFRDRWRWPVGRGIAREVWNNIPGSLVSNLTSHASFSGPPSTTTQLTSLEAPINVADNYGTRMRGYLHPPADGAYAFWIASDDQSELWLSTSAEPGAKVKLASVTGWTNSREWTKYPSQRSVSVNLLASNKYYIEVLHKEGGGGDNVAVAWQGPGVAQSVIPGAHLSPWVAGLPSPWLGRDIGATGVAGNATFASNTFTVKGSGADIWGSVDAFHFVYKPLSGDGELIARVSSLQNTDGWAKAGVMIREGLSAGSRHAFMALTPGNGSAFQSRSSTDGGSANVSATGAAPQWVRIKRTGSTFTGFRSSDGSNWITVGTVSIPMGSSVFIGLAATAHNNSVLTTAAFDSVR